MLRNVLIFSSSGLILFSKEFVDSVSQPRLIGSLITALIEFSTTVTGMPVSYIELTNGMSMQHVFVEVEPPHRREEV